MCVTISRNTLKKKKVLTPRCRNDWKVIPRPGFRQAKNRIIKSYTKAIELLHHSAE